MTFSGSAQIHNLYQCWLVVNWMPVCAQTFAGIAFAYVFVKWWPFHSGLDMQMWECRDVIMTSKQLHGQLLGFLYDMMRRALYNWKIWQMFDIHKAWKYNNYFSKDKYIQHEMIKELWWVPNKQLTQSTFNTRNNFSKSRELFMNHPIHKVNSELPFTNMVYL